MVKFLLFQILQQQERLLLRLEALEVGLAERGTIEVARDAAQTGRGLPVGAMAPDFSLPGLYGETILRIGF